MESSTLMRSSTSTNRIVALIDMDCFYVQVEERDDPSLKGKPAAVVQYNAWKGGCLLAVNYEARAKGVKRDRYTRGDEAKVMCPEIILVKVPEQRGKADLTKYRNAGHEVIQVLSEFCKHVERASVDEAYIDLTDLVDATLAKNASKTNNDSNLIHTLKNINQEFLENCFVVPSTTPEEGVSSLSDHSSVSWLNDLVANEMMTEIQDVKLLLGAELVGQMRKRIFEKTSFRCSAGIANNKVLAKLGCGINKPNKQTIVPLSSVPELFKKTKVSSVRNLGGKLGDVIVEQLQCEYMSDLLRFSEKDLINNLGSKCGSWVYQITRGFDDEAVVPRQLPKSIGCNKLFNGPEALKTKEKIKHWLKMLSSEVVERLQKDLIANNRRAKSLTLHVRFDSEQNTNHLSKSCGTHVHYDPEKMTEDAMVVMEKLFQSNGFHPVVNLGLIASKFEDDVSNCSKIETFFKSSSKQDNPGSSANDATNATDSPLPCSSKSITASTSKAIPVISTPAAFMEPTCSKSSSSLDEKPKSFFNRNPSPRKKFPSHLLPSGPNIKPSPKKQDLIPQSKSVVRNTSTPTKSENLITGDVSRSRSSGGEVVSPSKGEANPEKASKSIEKPSSSASADAFKSFSKDCEKCKKSIPIWDYVTHMDWHMARDLQREINGLPPITYTPNGSTETTGTSTSKRPATSSRSKNTRGKSKRGRTAKTGINKDSGMKTLDNYFTQKQ